ncbi:DUF3857 domain-containing protein [Flavobacterium orientale]|uniref:DUF3857 domain-containing protein n=1 Tax=Flavobacterium orientale TaxID=1756020 RepID=A0A917DAJ8_9FLAO|nr:DUF3857 domain-containing protein [Flavobacterium orientale]GGD20549.1 hypothetical protein GCM10011343_08820 [Flavobacterium orientale]
MKKFKIIFFLLLFSNLLNAQKLEFGKVSKQELSEKNHSIDTAAVAAILFKKAKTSLIYTGKAGFISETDYEVRLKIYKKEGFSWGNYSIPYYIGWGNPDNDYVSFSEVTTYNLENNKIKKSKLTSLGSFKEKINDYWIKKTITFPNVKEGSVIEFKYKIITLSIVKLPDFDFQETIPVNFAEYQTEIPVNFGYNTILNGDSKVEKETKEVKYGQSLYSSPMGSSYLNYTLRKSKYTLKNIQALKQEPFVDNYENYRIKIKNELSSVAFRGFPIEKFSHTWNEVTKDISQNEYFKNQIQSKGYFENDLKNVVNDSMNETEKVNAILDHVKHKIKWNKYLSYFPKLGVEKAYINGDGNVADINLNLLIMLRSEGVKAYPVLVSTRDNGLIYFPSREDFNYVIVKAIINDKQMLIDATDLNSTFNILPIRVLNDKGIMITESEESEEINLSPTTLSKSITFIQADIDMQGMINGKIRSTKNDYLAYIFRTIYTNISQDLYLEKLESDYNNIEISDYNIDNFKDLEKTIIETFSFSSETEVEINDNKIIFNPLLFYTNKSNPFISETRTMPIDFIFPNQDKYVINISIPEGYEIEHLPEPTNVYLHNNSIVFNFNISSDKNKITIASTFDINQATFSPIYYDDIRNIFKLYIEKQTESIILKRK